MVTKAIARKGRLTQLRKQAEIARPRKRPVVRISKARFIKALEGTGGRKSDIAKRLGCSVGTVGNKLRAEGWGDVEAMYQEEVEKINDLAEATIVNAMSNKDLVQATKNARWWLQRKAVDRGFGDVSRKIVEGGDAPIKVLQVTVPINTLKLPLEMRREILEALEEEEVVDIDAEVILGG